MSGDENTDEPKEYNLYKSTLENCRDTLLPDCRDTVHTGSGTPADAIANPIAAGGWQCAEADTWTTELTTHCSGILDAFNDAIDVVRKETGRQPEHVPARDWRGNSWPKQWQMERRMI
jgi:hypothetical protein